LYPMNFGMAGLGLPFLVLVTSYYFSDRQREKTIALAREIEGLRASVDLGVAHRQREAALRLVNLKAAKDDLSQRQGNLYQAMVRETEAKAGLAPDERVLAAEAAIAARRAAAQQAHDAALARYQGVARELAHATVKWREYKDEAQKLCWVVRNLETGRDNEHRKARAAARQQQLIDHLDGFFITHEKWKGFPKSALSALASFGVETAADIEHGAVIKVPGFGEVRTKALLAWRRQKEATFSFNPNKSDQGSRMQAVNRRIDAERQTHERALAKVKRQLDVIHSALEERKEALEQIMGQAADLFARAQADQQAVQGNHVVPQPVPAAVQRTPPYQQHARRKTWWQNVLQR
jgi:hypothetical protein